MSRIDELKKQHPIYALSAIDIFKMISPNQTNKYVEMLIKLDKSTEYKQPGDHRARLINEMTTEWGLDYNYLETLDLETLLFLVNSVNSLMNGKIRLFTKFASYNERKLIENNDVTTYSSWEELEQAVALADVKSLDKKLEKEIKKVYEDDTWLSLRPLSLEASMKYGANTKWCTTTQSGQYYARYSSRGILIYNINKKTGYKVACFKNIDQAFDNEFSWWDVTDKKIEVLDSEAPAAVLEAVRNEIKNFPIPNQILMSEEEQAKLEMYKEGYGPAVDNGTRMHITGGFTSIGTNSTLTINGSGINAINNSGYTVDYNPSTSTWTGNIGMATTNPTTQLSVNGGNIEVNDGDIVFRTEGEERARLTPDGFRFSATQESLNEDLERRLFAELTREINGDDRIAADAQQRLDDAVAEQLAEANERVAEKHLSLLENIEMGTLNNDVILKMQALAGIKTTKQQIQELEGEIEQLRARINDEEQEAEQPVLPLVEKKRKSGKNWINKLWSRLN